MDEEKRNRLEAIKDEVNDLHPLLKILLPRMPGVKNVEHTHGVNEMGADFLLSRFDDTFGQLDHIAVIAKVGKIDQPNVSDVDRQVDECFIPKLFNSGKEEVNVNEVWVVTNSTISNGAKIKINDKYRGRKINFIPGEKLSKFIDLYAPNFWTDVNLQLGDYLNQLRVRNDEIDRSVSLAKNNADIYIEQDICTVQKFEWEYKRRIQQKTEKVKIFDTIEREKAILVEGEMGAGKSKLLRHIIRHYTHPQNYLNSRIVPVFISYKNLIDNYDGDLAKVIKGYISEETLSSIEAQDKFLFLIDGVDEKNLPLEDQLAKLSTLIGAVCNSPNFKAIITSRELGSIQQNWDSLRRSTRLEIKPLSTTRTIEFVQKLCKGVNLSKRIFEDLKKSHLFNELPKSPIAAILLANLLQENTKELPSNMTELYTKYIELVLGRWDIDKGLQTQKEYEALDKVLMRLSKFIIENEIHYMAIGEAKEIVSQYLEPRNLGIDTERLFSLLTGRAGIIMCDPHEQRICFKHRTFAEYFYAKQKIRDADLAIDSRAFRLYWQNVFFFFAGQLRDCPDLLETLNALEPQAEGERLIKMINMGNYYMAGFASPYYSIERGIIKVISDAAVYYGQIVRKEIESDLASFSEMHLLCIFQMILRSSYAYDFFRRAIENAVLEIDDSSLDNTTKAYALFFLNVIYLDLDGKESFDLILKKHAGELPLSVQLAISHEGKDIKEKTALLKRHEKAMKRAVKGNKTLSDQLDIMYDRPIRMLKNKIT